MVTYHSQLHFHTYCISINLITQGFLQVEWSVSEVLLNLKWGFFVIGGARISTITISVAALQKPSFSQPKRGPPGRVRLEELSGKSVFSSLRHFSHLFHRVFFNLLKHHSLDYLFKHYDRIDKKNVVISKNFSLLPKID